MNIASEWKDSLSLLYPANLKLFLLVTLNTLRQTFLVWIQASGAFILFYSVFIAQRWVEGKECESPLIAIGLIVLLVQFTIAMRPSVGLKNYEYFKQYTLHGIICVTAVYGAWKFLNIFSLPIIIFFMLFLLDDRLSMNNLLSAIWRALKMGFYNFPFIYLSLLLSVTLFFLLPYYVIYLNVPAYSQFYIQCFILLKALYIFCMITMGICFFGNLYVKKSQEQYRLYFDK